MNLDQYINNPTTDLPTPQELISLRQHLQLVLGLRSPAAARNLCSELCGLGRDTWKRWEDGKKVSHSAFWALACLRADQILKGPQDGNAFYQAMKPRIRALTKGGYSSQMAENGRKGAMKTNQFGTEHVDYTRL